MMIFTILSRMPSTVMESPVYSEPPWADSLLDRAFTCFALYSDESQYALSAWRMSLVNQCVLEIFS